MQKEVKENIEILESRNNLKLYGEIFGYTMRILSLYKNKKINLLDEIQELLDFYEEHIEPIE